MIFNQLKDLGLPVTVLQYHYCFGDEVRSERFYCLVLLKAHGTKSEELGFEYDYDRDVYCRELSKDEFDYFFRNNPRPHHESRWGKAYGDNLKKIKQELKQQKL